MAPAHAQRVPDMRAHILKVNRFQTPPFFSSSHKEPCVSKAFCVLERGSSSSIARTVHLQKRIKSVNLLLTIIMDQILFATYTTDELSEYRRWADLLNVGLELHMFTDPALLTSNGNMVGIVSEQAQMLDGFGGVLGFHGAFYDMVSASLDPDVVALTLQRYRQNLEVAVQLKGDYVVFHANYMGGLKLTNYRPGWHRRQVDFWGAFAEEAARHRIYILLENMWADEPAIIAHVLEEVANPYLRACLDLSHARLFSQRPIEEWVDVLGPYLHVCHLNNTDGHLDLHWPLGKGVIDYRSVLASLRRLPQPPLLTLEMRERETIEASLPFLDLAVPT